LENGNENVYNIATAAPFKEISSLK